MSEHIGMSRFALSVGRADGALEATSFQDFGAQHFKAKASCVPLYRFDQSVQGLGVGIGDGMIEIGKDRFIPVAYSSQQWLKSSFQVRRDAGFPVLIGGFCLFTVAFLPDIEKALFEPVGGFQIRKVLRPAFQD